ncbi:MAG: HAMP domain-containing histidine kinase [Oscillospiraceae bacterium]|nr:HAMP domain-containing histidine kinase [Oscillospiraceae bacterium]
MDTIEKVINNKNVKKTIVIYFLIIILSFILSSVISMHVSDKAFENRTDALLMAVTGEINYTKSPDISILEKGEEILKKNGIYREMDFSLYEGYDAFRKDIFIVVFSFGVVVSTLWLILSLNILFSEYEKIENMRQKCICICEGRKYDKDFDFEYGSLWRLMNAILTLGERMNYCSEKLTQDKENIKDFLYDFSHQLKTSVAVLRLNFDILITIKNISEEKRNSLYEEIMFHIDSMEDLVLSSLKLAKINAGAIKYNYCENSISDICKQAVKKISPIADKIKITFDDKNNDIILKCDKLWMREAVENIIKNSVDHSQCTEIKITAEEVLNTVTISIHDNGKGIAQDKIKHIFKRFGNVEGYTNNKNTGIGMSIANKIITGHNGEIFIKSEQGEGTDFQIVFLK